MHYDVIQRSYFWLYPKEIKSKKDLHIPAHWITKVCNEPKCPSMNKENCVCVCVCDGIIFLKKEGNVIICKKVNESRGHCAKLNKPYLEKQVSHDFTFKWIL